MRADTFTTLSTMKSCAADGRFFKFTTLMFWSNTSDRTEKRVLDPTAIADWNKVVEGA